MGRIFAGATVLLVVLACGGDDGTDTADPAATSTQQPTPSATASAREAGPTIVANDFSFSPKELRIRVGDTVRVRNNGNAPHTFTARPGQAATFDVALDERGDDEAVRFERPGTVAYVCTIHEAQGMTGTVVVES